MAALTMTGYVIGLELIHASASEGVEKASSEPLMIGTLALMANSLADVLSPNVLLQTRLHKQNMSDVHIMYIFQ